MRTRNASLGRRSWKWSMGWRWRVAARAARLDPDGLARSPKVTRGHRWESDENLIADAQRRGDEQLAATTTPPERSRCRSRAAVRAKRALCEVAERSVPSRIAETLA